MSISVLIVTYRRDAFLAQALRSLQAQTLDDWEAIVVDNGSSRSARRAVESGDDKRFVYVAAPTNLGECGGRNLAFSYSSGEYVCYLDDDDILPPDSLASRLDFYRRHPQCGMIYGEYRRFGGDDNGTIQVGSRAPGFYKSWYDALLARLDYAHADAYYFLRLFNFVRGGTPLIRRRTLETVGLFDERYPVYGDYEMWLRIARSYSIRFLDKEVYHYRVHPASTERRFFADGKDKRWALMICKEYGIRRSLQFSKYRQDISRMWTDERDAGGAQVS